MAAFHDSSRPQSVTRGHIPREHECWHSRLKARAHAGETFVEPAAAWICASVAVARAPLSDWMTPRNWAQLFSRPVAAVVQAAAW